MTPDSLPPVFVLPEPGLAGLDWFQERLARATNRGPVRVLLPEAEAGLLPSAESLDVTTFTSGNLTGARQDMAQWREYFASAETVHLVRDLGNGWGYETFYTFLRLAGCRAFLETTHQGDQAVEPPPLPRPGAIRSVLVTMCGGIGNVVQCTPVVAACARRGWDTAFVPVSDANGASLHNLFADNGLRGVRVLTPEQAQAETPDLVLNLENRAQLALGDAFLSPYRAGTDQSEAGLYAAFMRNVTGLAADPGATWVGGLDAEVDSALLGRVVVCPGSKPGWEPKRWPRMNELLLALSRPLVLCREQDLDIHADCELLQPLTAPNAEFALHLDLAQAAQVLRHARCVVAHDCGMAHVAAAAGAPTLILFGPSSVNRNRPQRDNARALRLGLACSPCQGRDTGPGRLAPHACSCDLDYACMAGLSVEQVLGTLRQLCPTIA